MTEARTVRTIIEFERDLQACVGALKGSAVPMLLTVNGNPAVVVQDATSYQALLDRLEHAETVAAIRNGIRDANEGRMMPLAEATARLLAKHGV